MNPLLSNIHIKVNEKLFLKDPDTSDLGKKILSGSIELIHQLGFEHFTFQKLAKKINTTEASIYRYFESKQKLLLFLYNWYWCFVEYQLIIQLNNIENPSKRLIKALKILVEETKNLKFDNIDVSILQQIVYHESSKACLIKEVDRNNKDGAYLSYKRVVELMAAIIKEIKPNYKYPNMLISTVIDGIQHQNFYAEHLPRLTNKVKGKSIVFDFYWELISKSIK